MKLLSNKIFNFFFGLILAVPTLAQDIQWAQYYGVPLFQNPAFAGAEHCDHFIFQQRLQWPGLEANYTSSYVSYDRYLYQYRSGVGGYIVQDFQGIALRNDQNYENSALSNRSIDISTTKIAGQYAYELPIDATHSIRAGIELGLMSSFLNSNYIFPSEIDPVNGYTDQRDNAGGLSRMAVDVATGVLYYSKHLYMGFTGSHLNKPDLSLTLSPTDNQIARRGTFIAGYKINFSKSPTMAYLNQKISKSITPIIHYKFQEKSDQMDFGLYGVYDHLMFGTWYRGIPMKKNPTNFDPFGHNNESIVLMAGWKYNGWKWSLSYDWIVSTLTAANPRGAYEFSMAYVPCRAEKKSKPMKRLPCPVPSM